MKKQEEKNEYREIALITTDGKEIIVSYVIEKNITDYILKDIQKALEKNSLYFGNWTYTNYGDCPHSDSWKKVKMTLNNLEITELDMHKIIGIRW